VIANLGNYFMYVKTLRKIKATKQLDILALGGSITAGGYYMVFKRHLEMQYQLNVTVHNHGHGATEIQCKVMSIIVIAYVASSVLLSLTYINANIHMIE
jgi:hypothetical protein